MSDWEEDDEVPAKTGTTSAPAPTPYVSKNKFEGEDEEEEADDWDASEDEKPKQSTTVAPPAKKRGTLKAKLAEKAALGASGATSEDDLMDEQTPQEKRRAEAAKRAYEKEKEQEADLAHAADLLGIADDPDVVSLTKANPKDKAEFQALAIQVFKTVIERLGSKPLYSTFAEELARQLMIPLSDVEARKLTQVMGVVANEKTKEAKEKIGGKKKGAAKGKPALGANKALATKIDSELYDEALDDGDFM